MHFVLQIIAFTFYFICIYKHTQTDTYIRIFMYVRFVINEFSNVIMKKNLHIHHHHHLTWCDIHSTSAKLLSWIFLKNSEEKRERNAYIYSSFYFLILLYRELKSFIYRIYAWRWVFLYCCGYWSFLGIVVCATTCF